MPADTIPILVDLEVPLALVEALVKQHLLASLTPTGNDHATQNGHGPLNGHAPHSEKEDTAPVLPSSTGVP
jgi:hypothetical protein